VASAGAEPGATWAALDEPWRVAFEEAWTSWCTGNYGIGAALVDPASGRVVSVGRNRVTQRVAEPRQLSGNFVAHAEMNAFAAMESMLADGLHLYTTLQPCLMCAGAAIALHVEQVHFAARDEFFPGLEDLWANHDYSRDRQPRWEGPLGGCLERFARALPLSFTLFWLPDSLPAVTARAHEPEVAALAAQLIGDPGLVAVRDRNGPVVDALTALWDRLADWPPAPNS